MTKLDRSIYFTIEAKVTVLTRMRKEWHSDQRTGSIPSQQKEEADIPPLEVASGMEVSSPMKFPQNL